MKNRAYKHGVLKHGPWTISSDWILRHSGEYYLEINLAKNFEDYLDDSRKLKKAVKKKLPVVLDVNEDSHLRVILVEYIEAREEMQTLFDIENRLVRGGALNAVGAENKREALRSMALALWKNEYKRPFPWSGWLNYIKA